MADRSPLYASILERIFLSKYSEGDVTVEFERSDIERVAAELGVRRPKNLGDVLYTFRYRAPLPTAIRQKAREGQIWIIRPAGSGRYKLEQVPDVPIVPNRLIIPVKIPNATPGIIIRYALSDEQALLARVRYNRLVDIFCGASCYSLQSHLRTSVPGMGQVETDELYVGIDRRGAHFVFPIQAKGGNDRLSVVQIEQDIALCGHRFPGLICRLIAAQFMAHDVIALFELGSSAGSVGILAEKHYRLVPPDEISPEELESYQRLTE